MNEVIFFLHLIIGSDKGKIGQDVERNYFMSSLEAKEYGIVDEVLKKHLK
ncbi:MAG: ATP-dependent Clp protease proteolytic subunit [Candidatus Marinimicrobia bacterium]|nr:ATP-dependent Clp protease proteolytic subunit [Candidatus Neomarinimicrobiota bacterium]